MVPLAAAPNDERSHFQLVINMARKAPRLANRSHGFKADSQNWRKRRHRERTLLQRNGSAPCDSPVMVAAAIAAGRRATGLSRTCNLCLPRTIATRPCLRASQGDRCLGSAASLQVTENHCGSIFGWQTLNSSSMMCLSRAVQLRDF